MVKKFYICRHGETFATKRNSAYGWKIFSASILAEGKPAVERQAEFLKQKEIAYCVSSPVKRCRQTAAIIRHITDKDIFFDRRIGEFFLETFGMFKKRVEKFLSDIDAEGCEEVLVITHGAVIAALTHLLTQETFKIADMVEYPKPGVMTVIKRGQSVQLIDFNLEQPMINE